MEKLNVRFTQETKKAISKVSESIDLFDSAVARAALNIGLKIIEVESLKDGNDVYGLINNNQNA